MKNAIPYGYDIKNGQFILDEIEAPKVQKFFEVYLEGLSLLEAGKQSGVNRYHAYMKKMLVNKVYLGTDVFPQIIDETTFQLAKAESDKRLKRLNRWYRPSEKPKPKKVPTKFKMWKLGKSRSDPFEQAQYIYSKIKEVK
jgi:hypothetical protein